MAAPDPNVALAQLMKEIRERLPALLEYEEHKAKLSRKRYLELVREGFTKDEALKIVVGSYGS